MKKRNYEGRDIYAHSFIEDISSPLDGGTRRSLSHTDRLTFRPATSGFYTEKAPSEGSAMQNYNNTM